MFVTPTNIIPALLVCFFAWRVIRRIRRTIGRQPIQPKRMTMRIVIFSVFALFLAAVSPHETLFMLGLGGGLLAGMLLALVGLRLTRFEVTNEGHFYTPNMYIGVAVSLLLVGRVVYRLTLLHDLAQDAADKPPALMQSSLTLLLFGLVAGYYITYYLGLFICSGKMSPAKTGV